MVVLGVGRSPAMKKKRTLKEKVFHLWKKARLPKFLNKYGPKTTPALQTYLCYLEYTVHAPAWRRAAKFMGNYHKKNRHWTTPGRRPFKNGLHGSGMLSQEQAWTMKNVKLLP